MYETLDKLKRRIAIADHKHDDLLHDLIDEAETIVQGDTGQAEVPALCDPVVIHLAAGMYNQMGLEGEKAHSEGGISVTLEALPAHLKRLLDRCRVGKVGGV